MGQYSSYYLYQRYEQRDGQDPIPCYPNTYSIDGDGTMPLVMKEEYDQQCGYTGDCAPVTSWEDVPVSEDYVCDECELDIEFRWVSTSAYTYFGDYRYEIVKEQFRKDGGEWIDTNNTKYSNTGVKVGKKIKVTMYDGQVFSQSCGDDSGVWHSYPTYPATLYSENAIQHWTNTFSGDSALIGGNLSDGGGSHITGNQYIRRVEFGDCVTEIGWRYRNRREYSTGGGCGASYWDNDVTSSGERMRNTYPEGFSEVGLEEIVFPQGLRWIGLDYNDYSTFGGNLITALTIPSSVESIGLMRSFDQPSPNSSCMSRSSTGAFVDNIYLKQLNLNEGLKVMGCYEFSGCTSLEKVVIPSTLERIGYGVFYGCTQLKQIIFSGSTPPTFICDDDSTYYYQQCTESLSLAVNDDVFVYVPCGSKGDYARVLNGMSSDRIIEYGDNCPAIPSIDSMYRVLYSYKVGSATTNVYKGAISASTVGLSNNDFVPVRYHIDEIAVPSGTSVSDETVFPQCGKLSFNGCDLNNAYYVYTHAREVEINTSDSWRRLFGDSTTTKVTVGSGCTPTLYYSFVGCGNLEEIHIHGNATLSYRSFQGCPNIHDIYITYDGGMIAVNNGNADYPVLHGANPTVHVPCSLLYAYRGDSFWSNFDIVSDDPGCVTGRVVEQ